MALFPDIRNGRASANAMTAGQQRQDVWLQAWQQRQQQNNPNYNPGWMPKEGWRGRFNQSQQTPAWKTVPKAPVPGSYEHTGPREPVNTPGVPYAPPAPHRPLGFNTLAPTGVPEGGWGGGAIQYETAPPPPVYPAYDGPPRETNVPGYAPGVEPPRPWENQPLTGRAGQDQWLKGWHQRQRGKSGYDASWAPQAGWRGRFNQGGANAMMEY